MAGPRDFEFGSFGRRYLVSRYESAGALSGHRAVDILRARLHEDSMLRSELVRWALCEHYTLTSGMDDQRVLDRLLLDFQHERLWLHDDTAPSRSYTHTRPTPQPRPAPAPPPSPGPNEIFDSPRSLLITHCPPQFDPRREPLRIAYLLRELQGFPVELVIRSKARPEPPVHRRMLAPAETADGAATLDWDGKHDATGELVERELAPFVVELVHDRTYRDQAPTTLPPVAVVHVVEMEDLMFATDREIFMPDGGFDEDAEDDRDRATGLHAIAAVLRHAAFHRGQKLCVFGHTDTVGSDADNLQLSTDRATNIHHVLAGDADGWAAHCEQHYEVADFQRVLKWVAHTKGWPTDPGAIDSEFGDATRAARNSFRALMNEHYGTALEQGVKQNAADWSAYFTLFDEELGRILGATAEDLARIRGGLEFTSPATVGCGEAFPAEQPDVNNFASAANRRVDIVFFEPDEVPALPGDPPGAPLYGSEDYQARYLPIGKGGGRVPVLLRLLDGDKLLAGAKYIIEHDDEVLDSGTTESNGTILVDLPRDLPGIVLRLPALERSYVLDVAQLAPLSELAGAQARLSNLGYGCDASGEHDDETRDALIAFQKDHELEPTGELDGATLTTLREVHDL